MKVRGVWKALRAAELLRRKGPTALVVANEHFEFQSVNPLDLAEVLAREGWNVIVAAPLTERALSWNAGRGFRCARLRVRRGRLGNIQFWFGALREARRQGADVIVGVNAVGLVAASLAKALGLAKKAVWYALELTLSSDTPRSVSARMQARMVRGIDFVVATGKQRAQEMLREFALAQEPEVIANSPIRAPMLRSTGIREEVRNARVRGRAIVVYAGALGRANCLVEATHASRIWRSDACLVMRAFGGSRDERVALERAVAEAKGRALLLPPLDGNRDVLLSWLSGADVGLVLFDHRFDQSKNARWYTPNKLYDYVACGLPVVASENPSLKTDVEARGIGFCCDPRDPRSIASAVDETLLRREECAARSRELFEKELRYEKQAVPLVRWLEKEVQVR